MQGSQQPLEDLLRGEGPMGGTPVWNTLEPRRASGGVQRLRCGSESACCLGIRRMFSDNDRCSSSPRGKNEGVLLQ